MVDAVTYRYTAAARRVEGWWIVQCDQLPGALSQVKRLDRAAEEHREAIAFVAGQPVDQIEVEIHAALPPELAAELDESAAMVESAHRDLELAQARRRKVARQLADDGLTVRDIGAVFGVSYQRAHQMVREA